jgi:hypothetical protein
MTPCMQPMSLWELVKNSPEWVAAIASIIFGGVMALLVFWQVVVMRRQGENSDRHERIANRTLRLQIEREWILQRNRDRRRLLKLARKLQLAARTLASSPPVDDPLAWDDVQSTADEITSRLRILDLATLSSEFDSWFSPLEDYAEAILNAWIAWDKEPPESRTRQTKKALKDADTLFNPGKIRLDLETAIRMEYFDFKSKWDAVLIAAEPNP